MSLNRRDFLRNAALASAGLVAPAWAGARPGSRSSEWILGGGRYALPEAPRDWRYVLSLVDPFGSARRTVELGFLPHAAVLDPTNPERAVTFEKIGPGAADVDLASMTRTLARGGALPSLGLPSSGPGSKLPVSPSKLQLRLARQARKAAEKRRRRRRAFRRRRRERGDGLGRGGRELDSRSNRAIDAAERKANRQVSRVRGVARGVRHRHNLAHAETVL